MVKPLKILVTGAGGQLAHCLKEVGKKTPYELLFLYKKDLNITYAEQITHVFEREKPDFVINTAAFTQVDQAEVMPETAYTINAEAVKNLANACKNFGAVLIHISTDYVFDGTGDTPYTENDPTLAKTVYGTSKLKGEAYIKASELEKYFIIRTSWLYSDFGHNFYKTMLRLAEEKKELRVVNDQYGAPTNAYDLAKAILQLPLTENKAWGIYHYSNTGRASWYDFARAIMKNHHKNISVIPVTTQEFPSRATRPAYSVLNTQKFESTFSIKIPHWESSLEHLVETSAY